MGSMYLQPRRRRVRRQDLVAGLVNFLLLERYFDQSAARRHYRVKCEEYAAQVAGRTLHFVMKKGAKTFEV